VFRFPPFNTGTGAPRIKQSFLGNGNLNLHLSGSIPLVTPSPDIDTKLDLTSIDGAGQVCYSGHLYGDAFPNSEVFVVNSKGSATMLLTFATPYDKNVPGPSIIIGDNNRDMGSFSNVCVLK